MPQSKYLKRFKSSKRFTQSDVFSALLTLTNCLQNHTEPFSDLSMLGIATPYPQKNRWEGRRPDFDGSRTLLSQQNWMSRENHHR